MIRAVTFDAAGTLLAPREPVGTTYARVAAGYGIAAAPAAVEAAFRRALRAAPPLAFPGAQGAALAARERAWWRAVVAAALGAAGHPRVAACGDALFAHYAAAEAWHVFPDAAPALAALRARGLRLAVVSNFDGRLPSLLERLGLAPAFDAVVWSAAAGAAKPAAAIFAAALDRLGVPAAAAAHVGDDPEADRAGAEAAGMTGLLLDRGRARRGAVRGLDEVPARLDGLRRTGR